MPQPAVAAEARRVVGERQLDAARVEQAQGRVAFGEEPRAEHLDGNAFAGREVELKIIRAARLGVAFDGDGQLERLGFRGRIVAARAFDHRKVIDQKKERRRKTVRGRDPHQADAERRNQGHAEFADELLVVGGNWFAVLASGRRRPLICRAK